MENQFERTTIYIDDVDAFRDEIRRLKIEHYEAKKALTAGIYQAMFEVALSHEDEVIDRLQEGDD